MGNKPIANFDRKGKEKKEMRILVVKLLRDIK